MTGRPSTYDKDKADRILMLIAEGERSLRSACDEVGVAKGTFIGWVVDDLDGLSDRYMRARRIRAHGLFDEMIDIADDGTNDWIEREKKNSKGEVIDTEVVLDREHVQRSQLRVGTRQWALARLLRNEFSEKQIQEHVGKGGKELKPVSLADLSDAQLEALATLREKFEPDEEEPAPKRVN